MLYADESPPTLAVLQITRLPDPAGGIWIGLDGELDLATAELLDTALASVPDGQPVTLDLTAVTFADCAGLGCVLNWARRMRRNGRRLRVGRQLGRQVARLVDLLGAERVLWPDDDSV